MLLRRALGAALRRCPGLPRPASGLAPAAQLLVGGRFVDSAASTFSDVHDPATGAVVARTPNATHAELTAAVDAAAAAFVSWRDVSVAARRRGPCLAQQRGSRC